MVDSTFFSNARLFMSGDLAQSVGQLFVNFLPVTDRDDAWFAIYFVVVPLQILPPKDFLEVGHMLFQLVAELGADDIVGLALKLFVLGRDALHGDALAQIHG